MNLSTTDYIYGALAIGALWYGMKKSGLEKYALIGIGLYLAYDVYTDASSAPASS